MDSTNGDSTPQNSPVAFLNAARAGDVVKLEQCARVGNVDVNTMNASGLTALHLAAKEGHVDVINLLLNLGADYGVASKKGNTPLHTAALAGKSDVIRVLIQAGCDVNAQSQNGFTPLYMSAQENHAETVRLLLSLGARQDLTTEDGYTPLAVAIQQGHNEVVSILTATFDSTSGRTSARARSRADTRGDDTLHHRPPPLHNAARKDDIQAAQTILNNIANDDDAQKWELLQETTKSGFTALHVAARYGNQRIAALLIEHGSDINFTAKNAVTPLHVASKWGHANVIRLLLDMGASIEARTGDELTPLHCAARSGHEPALVLLLEYGALVSAQSRSGLTPLHMSTQGDHSDCVHVLLNNNANIDDVTLDNLTPLHIASHYGHLRTAKLLVENNANINALAPNGFTPLHIACKKNHLKVVELLLRQGAPLETHTETGLTALHVAAFMGNDNLVSYLLQRGADPNSVTNRGETPIHFAARGRRVPIMTQLLTHGALPDAKSKDLHTALHVSARQGDVEGAKLLLQHGASPNSVTLDLNTPLHAAAKEGHTGVADLLIDNGANKTVINKRGFSALHLAAKFGKLRVAKLLLDRGVNPNIEGKYNLTPLHVATHYGTTDVAVHLLGREAKPQRAAKNGYTPLHIASKRNRKNIAGALLQHGANPNAESVNGYAPLHLASSGGLAEIAGMLLGDDAQPDCRSKNGLAPMHLCAQEDRVNVAEILEQHGAEIDPQTKAGYTPLHTACHFGKIKMIQFLLRHGASVQATTKMGYTPLHQAAQQGQVYAIKILLKNKADTNALTASGQTALSIAENLGFDQVAELLQGLTDVIVSPANKKRKLNIGIPEFMQEAPMSDWEEDVQSPLAAITEEMEPSESTMRRTPAGLQLTARFGSDDIAMEKDVLDSPSEISLNLQGSYRSKSRGASPPRDLMVTPEPTPSWTWADDIFDGLQNGKNCLSTVSLGPNQFMKELQYMKTYASVDPMPESPYSTTPMLTDEEFFSPQTMQVQKSSPREYFPTPCEENPSKPTLGAVIGRNGGIVTHPQKVRVIIPPGALAGPTRITCRLVSRDRLSHPPPLKQAESLASRVVEMGPPGLKFLKPVIVEVPHFASLRDGEREISVRRNDGGRTWKIAAQPSIEESELEKRKAVLDVLKAIDSDPKAKDEIRWDRVTHIHTSDLPQYFAIVTQVHQQTQTLGPKGGTIKSTVDPNISVVIPPGSLLKNTPVNFEVQPVSRDLLTDLLGLGVPAVSPVVSVEPQEGSFIQPVTVSVPCPIGDPESPGKPPTRLRLIAGTTEMGDGPTCWKDITDAVPMSPTKTGVSFTPDLAAIRFMVLACPPGSMPDKPNAEELANVVYRETSTAPFLAKFIIFAKRTSLTEGQLKIFCVVIHDDDVNKLVDGEEGFEEVARSADIEVMEGKPQFIELVGNLHLHPAVEIPQGPISLTFEPFKKSCLLVDVQISNIYEDPECDVVFSRSSPENTKTNTKPSPTCSLNAKLPDSAADSNRYTRQQVAAGDIEYLPPDSDQPLRVEWPGFDEEPFAVTVACAGKVLSPPSPPPLEVEEMLSGPDYAAPAACAPKKEDDDDIRSKTERSESRSVLDDGSTVKRHVTTTTFYRVSIVDDVESEETVGVEIFENVVKLPPGVVEMFGRNVDVDVLTEKIADDVLPNGVVIRRTVRTMNINLRRDVGSDSGQNVNDKALRAQQSYFRAKSPVARIEDLLKCDMSGSPVLDPVNGVGLEMTTRQGQMEVRKDVEENENTMPDGFTIKSSKITTKYVIPTFEVTLVEDKQMERLAGEQLLKTNIEEITFRLPPGVQTPHGADIESESNEELSQEICPDGSVVNRKSINVIVRKISPEELAGWAWDIEKPLDMSKANLGSTYGKFDIQRTHDEEPENNEPKSLIDEWAMLLEPSIVDEPQNKTVVTKSLGVKEYRRGCRDGSVVIHRLKTIPKTEWDVQKLRELQNEDGAFSVEEAIIKLDAGIIEPDGHNVLCDIQFLDVRKPDAQQPDQQVSIVAVKLEPPATEIKCKEYLSAKRNDLIDGTVVMKKIKTKEYYKTVRQVEVKDGKENFEFHDVSVKFEIVENVVELHPGCVEPYGSNVSTDLSVGKCEECLVNGVPTKRQVIKLIVNLHKKTTVVEEHIVTPPKHFSPREQPQSNENSVGPIEVRTELVEDDPVSLENGGKLLHQTLTTTRVRPIRQMANVNGRPQVVSIKEEVIDKEIEESFVELPRGVEHQYGQNLESVTSVEDAQDAVIDNIPVKKTIRRVKVSRTRKHSPPDNEIRERVENGTLGEVIPVAYAKVESPLSEQHTPDISDKPVPTQVEYHRCLGDGTVLRRVLAMETKPISNDDDKFEAVLHDNVLALPSGTDIEPNCDKHDPSLTINYVDKPVVNESELAKVVVVTAVVSPKGEDIMKRKTVEGDVCQKVHFSDDMKVCEDGTKIMRNIKTTEHYRQIKDYICFSGIDTELQCREEPLLLEIVERVFELHPGCVETFGRNVVTNIVVNRSDEVLDSGVPLTKKVIRVVMNPKGVLSRTFDRDGKFVEVSNSGKVEERTEVTQHDPRQLPSGCILNHTTVETVRVKLVDEMPETILNAEVNEIFVELPYGVVQDQYDDSLEYTSKVESLGDVVVNGIPVKRKITRTKVVRRVAGDDAVIEQTGNEPLLNAPEMEADSLIAKWLGPVKKADDTEQLEYHRCLSDGRVFRRVAVQSRRRVPAEQLNAINPMQTIEEPVTEIDVEGCDLTIPTGVLDFNGTNSGASAAITVQHFDKVNVNGTLRDVSFSTLVVSRTEEGDKITRKALQVDIQSRTTWSEDAFVTDDGINVVRKTKSTHFFKPVKEIVSTNGIESESEFGEESIRFEIVENVVQLHPGCVEPFGSNVVTKVSVDRLALNDQNGIPIRKKVVKLVVTPKDKPEKQTELSNMRTKSQLAAPTEAIVNPVDGLPGVQVIEEPIELRFDVKEEVKPLRNGGTSKLRRVTTTRIKHFKEMATVKGLPQVLSSREEILDKEVDEHITELPHGLTEEYGKNLESITTVEHLDDAVIDGVLVKKTVSTTQVRLVDLSSLSDDQIREALKNAIAPDEIVPFAPPKLEMAKIKQVGPKSHPNVVECRRCLDDGTIVRRVVVATMCPISEDEGATLDAPERGFQVEVDENLIALPPGIIRPELDNCNITVAVRNFAKPDEDGTLVKASVTTSIIEPKHFTTTTVEGEVQARTKLSESRLDLDDGTVVLTKTKSVEFFKTVTDIISQVGDEKPKAKKSRDVTISFDIVDNVLELHPGCVKPFGSNISTSLSVQNTEQLLSNEIPLKRKVIKLVVCLKKECETGVDEKDVPEIPTFIQNVSRGPGSVPESEIIEEPIKSIVDVKEEQYPLESGGTLKRRKVTVTRVKPIKEILVVNDNQKVLSAREEVVDIEINEHLVDLPPGVTEEFGTNLESLSNVEHLDVAMVDGVPVKKTITTTKVRHICSDSPSDVDILRGIEGGTLSNLVPTMISYDASEPEAVENISSKPVLSEYHRCLEDGTVVRRIVATTKCSVPADDACTTPDVEVQVEPRIEDHVEENIIVLPQAIIEPHLANVDATITVKNYDELNDEDVPVKRNMMSAVLTEKPIVEPAVIEIKCKEYFCENRNDQTDGTVVIKKIKTKEYYKTVRHVQVSDGEETVELHDVSIRFEIVENVVELQPGCVEPYGSNVSTDLSVGKCEECLVNGVPTQRQVIKLIVKLKKDDAVNDQRILTPPKKLSVPEHLPSNENNIGPIEVRTELVEDDPVSLENGGKLLHQTLTTTRVRPIRQQANVNGRPQVVSIREEVIDKEIEESFVELPRGVEHQYGQNLESVTSVEDAQDAVIDNIPVKKTIRRVKVSRTRKHSPPDNEIRERVENGTLGEVIPVSYAKVESPLSEQHTLDNSDKPVPTKVEYHRCLGDGTVLRRVLALETKPLSNDDDKFEAVLHDNVLALPSGTDIEPNCDKHDPSLTINYVDKPVVDESEPAKVVVATAVVSPKGEDIMKRKTVEGDVCQKVHFSDDMNVREDGTKIMRNIKTTEHYRQIKDYVCSSGIDTELQCREEPLLLEIVERVFELHPGCVETFGRNVVTNIVVNRSDEVLDSGVPLTKKAIRVVMNPKGVLSVTMDADGKFAKATNSENVENRTEVTQHDSRKLPSGCILNHKTVETARVKIAAGMPEIVLDKEVSEIFVELPYGVVQDQYDDSLEYTSKVGSLGDVVMNGIPVKRKITRTKVVRRVAGDDAVIEQTGNEPLLNTPEMEADSLIAKWLGPVKKADDTEQLEYHRCLSDGRVFRRVAVQSRRRVPAEQLNAINPMQTIEEPVTEIDVEGCDLTIPTGVLDFNGTNSGASAAITVQHFEKVNVNGTPRDVSFSTLVVSRTEEGDKITRKALQVDIQSRTTWSEDAFVTDDGINVVRKTKSTHFFKPVKEIVSTNGIESESEVGEESIRFEIVENVVQLHPGCVEPFGSNVVTKVSVDRLALNDQNGIPIRKKVVKLVVTPKDKPEKQTELSNMRTKSQLAAPTEAIVNPVDGLPGVQVIEEPIELRFDVKEEVKPLRNGGTSKLRRVTTTRIKHFKEMATVKGLPQVLSSREEILDKEVDEHITELPHGVTEEYGKNLESITTVEHLDDAVIDGVLVKKTVSTTQVRLVDLSSLSDDQIREALKNAIAPDEIVPFAPPKLEMAKMKQVGPKSHPNVVECRRCLDDGTIVRRVVVATMCPISEDEGATLDAPERGFQVEVDENLIALPPGIIRPELDNCNVTVAVRNFAKPDEDGTLVKASVTTSIIEPKHFTTTTVEGEVQARTKLSESRLDLDDGTVVLTKTKSVEFFKTVTDIISQVGDEKPKAKKSRDVTISFDIVDNVLELHPGCVKPFGSNISTSLSVQNTEQLLSNEIPLKRKVIKLVVCLKKESETGVDEKDVPEIPTSIRNVSRGPGSVPESEIIEEPIESRVDVKEDQCPLESGGTLKRRKVTVTRVKPIKEILVVKDHQKVLSSREEVVDIEINEHLVDLPPGVTEEFGTNLESLSNVDHLDVAIVDGVPVKKTITTTKVRQIGSDSPSDVEILRGIESGTLNDLILVLTTISNDASEPEAVKIVSSQPVLSEYHRCLEDGTVVRRIVATSKCAVPADDVSPIPEVQPHFEVHVDENILVLPQATIEPHLANVDAITTVKNFEEPGVDEVPLKRSVMCAVLTEKLIPDGRRTVAGPVEIRRQVEEDRRSLDDGTTIKTKVITTRRVKLVTELEMTNGIETVLNSREETVSVDVEEHILELPAGVIEPSAANCDTDITVQQIEDHHLSDGTAAKLKVVRMVVRLKNQPSKSPVVRSVEGDIIDRVDVRETERALPDGTIVQTKVTTTRRLRPITELTVFDSVPTVTGYHEKIIGADVEEIIVRLGPGVPDPPTIDDPKFHVAFFEPTTRDTVLPDGTAATITTKITNYWRDPPCVTYDRIEGDIESKSEESEERKTRPDRSIFVRRTITTRFIKPVRIVTLVDGTPTDTAVQEELVSTEIEEQKIELPLGITDINDRSISSTRTEQIIDGTTPDGKPLRRKLVRIVGLRRQPDTTTTVTTRSRKLVSRKVRRVNPDGELVEDTINVDEDDNDDDAVSVGSATSSRRSSFSGDEGSALVSDMVGVFADVVELEPSIQTEVQVFDDAVLPDETTVRKRIVTTTEKRTVVMRALLPTDDNGKETTDSATVVERTAKNRCQSPVIRYVDVSKSEPETICDTCERSETLPNGTVVKRRIRTTGQRRFTTERTLLTGRLGDEHLAGVLERPSVTAPSNRVPDCVVVVDSNRTPMTTDTQTTSDEQTSRLVFRRHIHKKTILHGDKEETLITETTHVEQDRDPPPDLSASIQEVIEQFMSNSDQYGCTPAVENPPAQDSVGLDEAGTSLTLPSDEAGATVGL